MSALPLPNTATADVSHGDLTTRLQLGKSLGSGAYAVVYRATYDGRSVAVKVLLPQYTPSDRDDCPVKMFLREGDMLRRMEHRHIVRCVDVLQLPACFPGLVRGYVRPAWALVLELLEGGSLGSLMHRQLRAPSKFMYDNDTALEWSTQLASALAHLHGCRPPIIHRDVKLENIMLVRNAEGSVRGGSNRVGAVKLVDLGLATCPLVLERCTQRPTILRASMSRSTSAASLRLPSRVSNLSRPSSSGCAPGAVPACSGGGAAGATQTTAAAAATECVSGTGGRGVSAAIQRFPSRCGSAESSFSVFYALNADGATAYQVDVRGCRHGQKPLGLLTACGPRVRALQPQHQALLMLRQPGASSPNSPRQRRSAPGLPFPVPGQAVAVAVAAAGRRPRSAAGSVSGFPFTTAPIPAAGSAAAPHIFRLSETGEEEALRARASVEQRTSGGAGAREPGPPAAASTGPCTGAEEEQSGALPSGGGDSTTVLSPFLPTDSEAAPLGSGQSSCGDGDGGTSGSSGAGGAGTGSGGTGGDRMVSSVYSAASAPPRSDCGGRPEGSFDVMLTPPPALAFADNVSTPVSGGSPAAGDGKLTTALRVRQHHLYDDAARFASALVSPGDMAVEAIAAEAYCTEPAASATMSVKALKTGLFGTSPSPLHPHVHALTAPTGRSSGRNATSRCLEGEEGGEEMACDPLSALADRDRPMRQLGPPPTRGSSRPATATEVRLGLASAGEAAAAAETLSAAEPSEAGDGGTSPDLDPDLEWEVVYHLTRETGSCMTMAPEIRLAQPYNEKVDVYAFGVVLYELWSRSLLAVSHIGTRRPDLPRILHRCEDWPDVVVEGYRPARLEVIPEPIWQLITECWDQDPLRRPTMAAAESRLRSMAEDPALAEEVIGLSSGKGGRQLGTDGKVGPAAVPSCGCVIG